MFHIKEYISGHIQAEVCDMSHVREYSLLNKCKKMYSMNNMKLTVKNIRFARESNQNYSQCLQMW